MSTGTRLLDNDNTASMATLLMMSHHAFRRDVTRFEKAVGSLVEHESSQADALRNEWQQFRNALHGHHQMEDMNIFPPLRTQNPPLGPIIDQLTEQHHRIDPLLERGDHAFAGMTDVGAARATLKELAALLEEHLTLEEATVVPTLRGSKQFPPPPDDAAAEMYAGGFAWSMQGIADEVTEQVKQLLPESLLSRLPAAQKAFDERCQRVWGSLKIKPSSTSVPAS